MLTNYSLNQKKQKIRRALISVFDKTGIVELAQRLQEMKVEIISTGGSAKILTEAGISVVEVSKFTGFPEVMDGRVKTINPRIEGGILGLRDIHEQEAIEQNIPWIDLVVCNLYPFSTVAAKPETTIDIALENIDIGGPTMIRSAAKNHGWVTVVVAPEDYPVLLDELGDNGTITYETRKKLAVKAFGHTAKYDTIIHNYLKEHALTDDFSLSFDKVYDLRYGENPHQNAAAYRLPGHEGLSVLNAKVYQGKKLSYNNIMDADGALACLREFEVPTCVVVKHSNPCGVATGTNLPEVYKRAFEADSLSAFGGIIALNRTCTAAVAEEICKVFVEIVLAPDFEEEALALFKKKKNLRILAVGPINPRIPKIEYRYVDGGLLVQETDILTIKEDDLKVMTEIVPSPEDIQTMLFGWKVLKHVKSNGILLAKDNTTVGIGTGQVSRVDAVDLSIRKAGEKISGSILASDAFFPFRDSIDKIAGTGIKAVIQPGGSIRDKEVVEACNEHGIAMVFTSNRCFKH